MESSIGKRTNRQRQDAVLTPDQLAAYSMLWLRPLRELEQGKPAIRIDKAKQAKSMFGYILAYEKEERRWPIELAMPTLKTTCRAQPPKLTKALFSPATVNVFVAIIPSWHPYSGVSS